MDFEEFRNYLEANLRGIAQFELQEFHFEPYNFGSGLLAYRINGRIHQFLFDGKGNSLAWYTGEKHQKYADATLKEYKNFNGLAIPAEKLKTGIQNAS